MIITYIHRIGWFIGLVLLQVLILNNVHIAGYATPFLYIYFILKFDSGTSRNELMLWAFFFGLTIDVFADTPGMNAAATVLLAFLRPSLLRLFTPRDNLDSFIPSFKTIGITPFLKYTTASVFVHSLALLSIEFFSFSSIWLLLLRELPLPESLAEEDYRAQLLHLRQLCTELQSAADNRYRDAIEYYTTWAHQIKTPIASMRLALQGEDTALFRRLLSDLSRTEQYVEMVMAFLRLEDAPGDYVFREVALDEVLRQALRRFSAEFIDRRLDYTPTGLTVLTDEKWLCFVLEQLLSNALKYTREGSITVELAGERVLAIRDTGIGIAPEDLPRIFEKGYTGQNGRADKRASGLGLYLCSRICRNLGVGLTVKSTSGVGTTLLLDFTQYPLRVE